MRFRLGDRLQRRVKHEVESGAVYVVTFTGHGVDV